MALALGQWRCFQEPVDVLGARCLKMQIFCQWDQSLVGLMNGIVTRPVQYVEPELEP